MFMMYSGEAAGLAANRVEDASEGLTRATDGAGVIWAWDPVTSSWARLVVMRGDGTTILSSLAARYLGSANRWREIATHPRNLPIVGSQGDKAIPGDVLLVAGIQPQPFGALAPSSPSSPTTPTTPASPTTPSSAPTYVPGVSGPPPGWPANWPWPPEQPTSPDPTTPSSPTTPAEQPTTPGGIASAPPPWWPAGVPWPGPGSTLPTTPTTPTTPPSDVVPAGHDTGTTTSTTPEGLSTGAKIGIGVAVVGAVLGLGWAMTTRRRRRRAA